MIRKKPFTKIVRINEKQAENLRSLLQNPILDRNFHEYGEYCQDIEEEYNCIHQQLYYSPTIDVWPSRYIIGHLHMMKAYSVMVENNEELRNINELLGLLE